MPQMLKIQIVETPNDAPNYSRDNVDIRGATLHTAIIVKRGTETNKPTVDFQFRDEQGGEFVAMLTGELVKQLGIACAGCIESS